MRKVLAFQAVALIVGGSSGLWAAPPTAPLSSVQTRSRVQQALDSRSRLRQPGLESRTQSGSDLQGSLSGSATNPQLGTGRLPREVVRRQLNALRSRQSLEVRAGAGADVRFGNQARGGLGLQLNAGRQGQSGGSAPPAGQDPDDSSILPGAEVDSNGQARLSVGGRGQFELTHAERLLAKRLAQIDRMRDHALEHGDEKLLDQADHLELQARWQYAGRIAGRAGDSAAETGSTETGNSQTPTNSRFGNFPSVNLPPGQIEASGAATGASTTSAGVRGLRSIRGQARSNSNANAATDASITDRFSASGSAAAASRTDIGTRQP